MKDPTPPKDKNMIPTNPTTVPRILDKVILSLRIGIAKQNTKSG
jgi:hypothetical protein